LVEYTGILFMAAVKLVELRVGIQENLGSNLGTKPGGF
jgi:hypothetical protein